MGQHGKVAIFVGKDVTAHLVLNSVVRDLHKLGYEPVIFFPESKDNPKAEKQELKDFSFFEKTLLHNVIYPFQNQQGFNKASVMDNRVPAVSPAFLAAAFALDTPVDVPNVNDPAFVERIKKDQGIVAGLSIRCFQIFKPEIISAFEEKGVFLNLHPGVLPHYRGVISTARAMIKEADYIGGKDVSIDERRYGWTLHRIDKGIDTGNIVSLSDLRINSSKTAWKLNIEMAQNGANLVQNAFQQLLRGSILQGYPQDPSKGKYYTYPTDAELESWKNKIRLFDPAEVATVLVDHFASKAKHQRAILTEALETAIRDKGFNPYPSLDEQTLIQPIRSSRQVPVTASLAVAAPSL